MNKTVISIFVLTFCILMIFIGVFIGHKAFTGIPAERVDFAVIACDVCGKSLKDDAGKSAAVRFEFNDSSTNALFIKRQYGKYHAKDYNVCIECTLKAFGVLLPGGYVGG